MSIIGDNIKNLRERFGLTQAQIGDIAGVSDKAVSTWEKGTVVPRMGAIQKLADYFHIPKSQIIEESKRPLTDTELKFALFGGEEGITDAQIEEVKRFAEFIKERDKHDNK